MSEKLGTILYFVSEFGGRDERFFRIISKFVVKNNEGSSREILVSVRIQY